MNEILSQIISAARSNDIEGWMNILIVLILAIFWAIGGIIKAKTKKAKEEGEEQLTDRPARRRRESAMGLQKQSPQQPSRERTAAQELHKQYRRQVEQLRRKISGPRPIASTTAAGKKSMVFPSFISPEETILEKLKSEVTPSAEKQLKPEPKIERARKLKDIYADISAEKAKAEISIESLLDYTDPDGLRRAILHYEILGKPLSLRHPGEHIIGL
jgi:hypothetical protein